MFKCLKKWYNVTYGIYRVFYELKIHLSVWKVRKACVVIRKTTDVNGDPDNLGSGSVPIAWFVFASNL